MSGSANQPFADDVAQAGPLRPESPHQDASQWSGDSAIINGGQLIQISSVDVSTIDLSGFTMAVAAGDRFELTVGTNSTVDATKLASSVGLTITGSSGNDIFTGMAIRMGSNCNDYSANYFTIGRGIRF